MPTNKQIGHGLTKAAGMTIEEIEALHPSTSPGDGQTPRTNEIWREIELANHPETDGEHFNKFMQTARNKIVKLERELATARRDAMEDAAKVCPAIAKSLQPNDKAHKRWKEGYIACALDCETAIYRLGEQA